MQNIAPWRSRVATVRNLSVAAASHFKDAHFDFLYIDAGHEYQYVLDDLRAWWPKLRCGVVSSREMTLQMHMTAAAL